MKTCKIESGVYEIVGTDLIVCRGDPPKFGMPQEWHVCPKDDPYWPLLTANGKDLAVSNVAKIVAACRVSAETI